jgi:actin-related protein
MNANSPIVIDNKPDYIRAGLSSANAPMVVFRTDSVTSKSPMNIDGIVTNWDSMTAVWSHTFKQLGIDPSEHSVLVTEPPLNPKANREKMMQIFFETFNVSGLYLSMGEILALYDADNVIGTVVNFCADGHFMVVVPSYEGTFYPHTIIQRSFYSNHLSDDDIADIGATIYQSIDRCSDDVRSTLYKNIILTGNSSMFPGIARKIQKWVALLAQPTETVRVIEVAEPENGAWRGADKIVPFLSEYGSWMTRQEYRHFGVRLVHRKCFSSLVQC